jgi:hypothetical protein
MWRLRLLSALIFISFYETLISHSRDYEREFLLVRELEERT